MSYAFTNKTWKVDGEHNFGDFTLLNASFHAKSIHILEDRVVVQIEAIENGGMYKHTAQISLSGATETDVDALVDSVIMAAFPEAEIIE